MNIEWREKVTKKDNKFRIRKKGWIVFDEAKSFVNLGKDLLNIDKQELNITKHVVIIPDVNSRWAIENGLKVWKGHQKAASQSYNILKMLSILMQLGTKYLSFGDFLEIICKYKKRKYK